MLPPTVMADPISATTWPKAVVITAARANRASRATVHAVRQRPAPSVSAVRRMRGSTPWTAAAASAAAIGSASKTSPTTIACQVYSHSSPPSGPRRESTPYSSKPTTTVGNARAVLTTVSAARRPQKGRVASTKPTGMPRHAGVGREQELRAELVPAHVARRRAADRHSQGSAHIRGEPAPCLAAGEDELQPGICQDDVVEEWAGLTLRGQRILRRIHDVAVRS